MQRGRAVPCPIYREGDVPAQNAVLVKNCQPAAPDKADHAGGMNYAEEIAIQQGK